MQPSLDFQFSVTKAEAETILNALAQMPYGQVVGLIAKLQSQAQACVAQQQKDIGNG
jgi:hypothetical protein